jgi:hypothetical protein
MAIATSLAAVYLYPRRWWAWILALASPAALLLVSRRYELLAGYFGAPPGHYDTYWVYGYPSYVVTIAATLALVRVGITKRASQSIALRQRIQSVAQGGLIFGGLLIVAPLVVIYADNSLLGGRVPTERATI